MEELLPPIREIAYSRKKFLDGDLRKKKDLETTARKIVTWFYGRGCVETLPLQPCLFLLDSKEVRIFPYPQLPNLDGETFKDTIIYMAKSLIERIDPKMAIFITAGWRKINPKPEDMENISLSDDLESERCLIVTCESKQEKASLTYPLDIGVDGLVVGMGEPYVWKRTKAKTGTHDTGRFSDLGLFSRSDTGQPENL